MEISTTQVQRPLPKHPWTPQRHWTSHEAAFDGGSHPLCHPVKHPLVGGTSVPLSDSHHCEDTEVLAGT
jgi:hypothetical protein